jgi:tight adherence protein B
MLVSLGSAAFTVALFGGEAATQAVARLWPAYARWAEGKLRLLHTPMSVGAFFARHLLAVLGGATVGYLLGSGIKMVLFTALGAYLPLVWLKREEAKRQAQLTEQLDPGLQLMANAVLATQNLLDGFESLAKHGSPPLSLEAGLLVKEMRVGASIDEAMHNLAVRCKNRNVDTVITALGIGRRTGGNLPKVLTLIASVLRETMRVEGMMASKTAEGRASGWVMAGLPVIFLVAMSFIQPQWTEPLFNDIIGNIILGIVVALTVAGGMLIRKISTIDV